ncbi:hypothetical protein SISSUDRAFT_1038184 [Sistotremastrum suecicum HHB10207 ss-3]|uniref:Uncharacterized protein n=1 Tax=Sistotremastrum suecicum HHB10207 ss-3 TaxID=1314776 RepID=A0A165X474_9AGAM|nr:hypothetical protein SISSUDRAFT_1038184 [Sistotremastrum suecicum HHB10207 ss-3]
MPRTSGVRGGSSYDVIMFDSPGAFGRGGDLSRRNNLCQPRIDILTQGKEYRDTNGIDFGTPKSSMREEYGSFRRSRRANERYNSSFDRLKDAAIPWGGLEYPTAMEQTLGPQSRPSAIQVETRPRHDLPGHGKRQVTELWKISGTDRLLNARATVSQLTEIIIDRIERKSQLCSRLVGGLAWILEYLLSIREERPFNRRG